jgi:PDZ domain
MKQVFLSCAAAALVLGTTALANAEPYLGVAARANVGGGVKIVWVDPDSVANDLGLEPGDVMLTINGQFVRTGAEARDAVLNSGGHVTLLVQTGFGDFEQVDADLEEPVVFFSAPAPGAGNKMAPGFKPQATAKKARAKAVNVTRKKLRK